MKLNFTRLLIALMILVGTQSSIADTVFDSGSNGSYGPMNITTNTYLNDGHNYQDGRLTIYLPGNGGLLAAIAMMCAGYDGSTVPNPGIPKNGKWKVKWEGLKKMP